MVPAAPAVDEGGACGNPVPVPTCKYAHQASDSVDPGNSMTGPTLSVNPVRERRISGYSSRMEALLLDLTRGNVPEVKIVLATVVALLAAYQVALMAVGYGKLRLPFLKPVPASKAHRAVGDSIVAVTLAVAVMCIGYFGFEDDSAVHILLAVALLVVLGFKILVVRRLHNLGHWLPALGISVFLLFWATWMSAAAEHLL